jgi:hypothetical protein
MIVRSAQHARVEDLLRQYTQRVQQQYMAYQPPPDRPGY